MQETYMRVKTEADARGFIYAYPDGTRSPVRQAGQFWNGANCCQDPVTPPIDDVGYLDHIIQYVQDNYDVDRERIYLIGHSNGAFMASRYACERSGYSGFRHPQIAAIATLAGGQYFVAPQCGIGIGSVAVPHIHATLDEITPYAAPLQIPFIPVPTLPAGTQTVANWAIRNGCGPGHSLPSIDLVSDLAGAETSRRTFPCLFAPVEFWTIHGGAHTPNFYQPGEPGRTFGAQVLDWLLVQKRHL
jgi:polyhydroxybutyrate depolymerase